MYSASSLYLGSGLPDPMELVAVSTKAPLAGASFTLDLTADLGGYSLQPGDLVVACASTTENSSTPTVTPLWNGTDAVVEIFHQSTVEGSLYCRGDTSVFAEVMGSTPRTSITATATAGSNATSIICVVLSNGSSWYEDVPYTRAKGSGASVSMPSNTSVTNKAMHLFIANSFHYTSGPYSTNSTNTAYGVNKYTNTSGTKITNAIGYAFEEVAGTFTNGGSYSHTDGGNFNYSRSGWHLILNNQ